MTTKVKKVFLGAILMSPVMQVSAALLNFEGNIVYHNDIVRVDFTLDNDTDDVRIWTDSFMATAANPDGTNFDPITALWNAGTGSLIEENDDDDTIDPNQTFYDSGFTLPSLAAGDYFLTVATYENSAAGDNIDDGFDYDGDTPIEIALWDQPDNPDNARGTYWSVNLDGVDSATAVPVPAAIVMFAPVLLGLLGLRRRTNKVV